MRIIFAFGRHFFINEYGCGGVLGEDIAAVIIFAVLVESAAGALVFIYEKVVVSDLFVNGRIKGVIKSFIILIRGKF